MWTESELRSLRRGEGLSVMGIEGKMWKKQNIYYNIFGGGGGVGGAFLQLVPWLENIYTTF